MLAGLLGVGVGVTTYSANSALLSVTRIASRITLIAAGIIMLFMGVFNKFGALLGTIPTPIIGAQFAVSLALVAGVAFYVLKVSLQGNTRDRLLGDQLEIDSKY